MAYDEDLAARVRALLGDTAGVTEQPMFGALSFLVGGKLAIAVGGPSGGVLVPVGADAADDVVAETVAEQAVMGKRTMRGWVAVGAENLGTERELGGWVRRGVEHVRSRPANG